MTAHLIVRATVPDPSNRDAFDKWYRDDHMAEVIRRFDLTRCWRSWSILDPSIHYACYEFESVASLEAMMSTPAFGDLVDDFTRTWAGKVTRERDMTVSAQVFENPPAAAAN